MKLLKELADSTNKDSLPGLEVKSLSIEETLRLRYSYYKPQPKVSPTESELTPNAYYNVDDNQNIMDIGQDQSRRPYMEREVILYGH